MASRGMSIRELHFLVFGNLVAILAVAAAHLVWPFSKVLNAALFTLLGLFFATSLFAITHALIFVITRGEGLGVLHYARARIISAQINRLSQASDPLDVRLSPAKLRLLCPELFESRGNWIAWLDRIIGSRAALIFQIADHLSHGDSRAAVVVSVAPLLVAAYTDEMDCIAMLRFPDNWASEHNLHVRDRLVTVNRYTVGGPIVPDLEHGRLSYNRFSNFLPLIADFLTDDHDRLRQRKMKIGEDEWVRTWVLAERYREKHGPQARDGRPPFCMRLATVGSPDEKT
jgi:hypothetical protein